ncbi:protein panoramix [Drosophila elegans]|uniref:protein panoramix n=1 Tax=Drosophila elegans TaxID=30023 RepID=UPI0007E6FFE3|nr:protein panoramix [Drosophila elegans]
MDLPIKLEVKVENCEEGAIDEDEATPLRQCTGDSPLHAFATEVPMSGSGWDSDPGDGGPRSAPPTPGAHLENHLDAVEPKAEPKIKEDVEQMLENMLNDPFDIENPAPAHVLPTIKLQLAEQGSCSRYGLPSDFRNRKSLDDMDLCTLDVSKDLIPDNLQKAQQPGQFDGGDDSDNADDLVARKREILRELGSENGKLKKKKKKHKKDRSHRSSRDQEGCKKRKRSASTQDESLEERCSGEHRHRGRRHRVKTENPDELECVPVRADERHIRLVAVSNLYERQPQQAELNTENLSKADKRNLAVARAELVLEMFQKRANKEKVDEYHMVDTVCKLPINESFRNQGCFENPSPLCNNMNVVYEFNSTPGTKIDLAKWGLEAVPRATSELLRLLGIDVARLKQIQSTAKPSQRILKLKQEQLEQGLGPDVEADTATLYKNAATQTERMTATHDAGTQVRLESLFKGAFWQDPNFDQMNLTQQQSNVMYSLQALSKSLPDATLAMKLYRALEPAVAIKRATERQNTFFN